MYKRIEKLAKERNLRPSDIAKGTGISKSSFTRWKQGEYSPSLVSIEKIADFFEVSVTELIGK